MNNIDYDKCPFLNQSGMKKLLISPAHYKAWLDEPKSEHPESNLRIGLATHALALEPETFDSKFAVEAIGDRRTKQGKLDWAEFLERSTGKICMSPEEFTVARNCADSVKMNPWFIKCMADPLKKIEMPLYIKNNKEFRHGLKGRTDLISLEHGVIVDIKTTSKPLTHYHIRKAIIEYNYALQELTYTILANQNGLIVQDMIFIFVETKEPFSCVSVGIDNEKISRQAMDDFARANESFNDCMDTNFWPDLREKIILV